MKLTKAPILRLYHLTIESKDKQKFEDEGVRSMTTSIKNEAGTLFMMASHEDQAGTSNYVLECYQDLSHYQVHAASPQFKHYGQVAQKVLAGRAMFELTPQLVATKPEKLMVTGNNNYYLRLLALSLKNNGQARFAKALRNELKMAVAQEKGVKAALAGTLPQKSNEWRILEVYQDQATYQKHLQTEWFKDFSQQIEPLIAKVTIHELKVDTLVDQGQIEY